VFFQKVETMIPKPTYKATPQKEDEGQQVSQHFKRYEGESQESPFKYEDESQEPLYAQDEGEVEGEE
jgi:hypothetical protein